MKGGRILFVLWCLLEKKLNGRTNQMRGNVKTVGRGKATFSLTEAFIAS